jgi:hypothetical protein
LQWDASYRYIASFCNLVGGISHFVLKCQLMECAMDARTGQLAGDWCLERRRVDNDDTA